MNELYEMQLLGQRGENEEEGVEDIEGKQRRKQHTR
jgi:hypothetical protein